MVYTKEEFLSACKNNNLRIIKECVQQMYNLMYGIIFYEESAYVAAKAGNLEIIQLLTNDLSGVSKDICLNKACEGACEGGHMDIVNWLIEKGEIISWKDGLQGACRGGHLDLVKLSIEKGANVWKLPLRNACIGGNIEIINYLIEKGENYWDLGLEGACIGGHMDIVRLMIQMGADNLKNCLSYACEGKNIEIINYIINYMIENNIKIDKGDLRYACRTGNMDIVDLLIGNRVTDFNAGLQGACECGNMDMAMEVVNWMLLYADNENYKINFNSGLIHACMEGKLNIVKFFIKEHSSEYYNIYDAIDKACQYDMFHIIDYLKNIKHFDTTYVLNICRTQMYKHYLKVKEYEENRRKSIKETEKILTNKNMDNNLIKHVTGYLFSSKKTNKSNKKKTNKSNKKKTNKSNKKKTNKSNKKKTNKRKRSKNTNAH